MWSKAGDFLWRHLIFKPRCMNSLHTPSQRAGGTPSSCSPECALARLLSQRAPYFSDSLKSWHQCLAPWWGCGQLAAESHIVIQVAFQVSCFSPFTFWFILGSDLKSRCFVLEEAAGGDLHLQCRQRVSSDLPFFVPSCSCLFVCAYPSLFERQHDASFPAIFQVLQENPEVLQGSSFSITWVCPRANNQQFMPTHGRVNKAP